jgi:hypothetical protein
LKPIAFKISDQKAEQLSKFYGNRNRGAQRAVESWIILRVNTILELKGIFTSDELLMMITNLYENTFDPKMTLSNEIFAQFIKSICKDDASLSYIKKLTDKIRNLTAAQVYFLSDWLDCYCTVREGKKDLDWSIENLAKKEE